MANPYFGIDTDDNPETTLKGTGFKDVETANKTIELVSKRSLTCKHSSLSLAFGPVNLSSADDICFGPLNYPTPWRPPGQVVCILNGSTVCVECSEKGALEQSHSFTHVYVMATVRWSGRHLIETTISQTESLPFDGSFGNTVALRGHSPLTRSTVDQRQTINTMCNRAKHHPKKTDDIKAAQAVFEKWLKETYPKTKSEQREFKPVLAKKTMETVLPLLKEAKGVDTKFADMYVELEPRKRLANTLVDESQPGEADWDKARTTALSELVPEGKDDIAEEKLWGEDGKPSTYHLSLIAWAWSPTTEYKLLKAVRE